MQTAHYIITWIYYFLMIVVVKGLVQINIPFVNYFYNWKVGKFIRMYTNLCQFKEFGKFKWPPSNFTFIVPNHWFNDVQYKNAGNKMFEGTGTDIFDATRQVFLVKQFIDKKGKRKEEKKTKKIARFWNNTQTLFDKIANIINLKSKEKQQVLVIYQSDDNYTRLLNSNENKTITYTGEHSLLFVFYLIDKTEIYRINNAEIIQEEAVCPSDNRITRFYINRTLLESI
jgi:hypothetical protein